MSLSCHQNFDISFPFNMNDIVLYKKQLIPNDVFETSTSLPLLLAQNDIYSATLDA
jgi:hypothetical protein